MTPEWKRMLAASLVVPRALGVASCKGQSGNSHAQSEVRALYKAVAEDGRAHRFTAICDQYSSGLLKELYYLFKIDCPKLLAGKWAEGVQLARIGPSTRITISGKTATVYDGLLPDKAVLVRGRWTLLESPGNHRASRQNEVLEAVRELNPGFRKHHRPELNLETRGPGE
jgi:hypothetical protein